MAASELGWHITRFPWALGALLVSPRRALGEIEAGERGGVSLALIWCLLAALALRFTALAEAVLGMEAGGGMRIVAVLTSELTTAVPAALIAALIVVALAGNKRDPSLDLELGAAAVVPFLLVRAIFRAGTIVFGVEPGATAVWASYVAGGAWSLALVVVAAGLARGRPSKRPPEAGPPERRRALLAGGVALAGLAGAMVAGGLWTARHAEGMGPLAKGSPAPEIRLQRVDGAAGTVALSDLRGKVVVLDFFATWCAPCLAMLPALHQLHADLAPGGVAFLGIDSDGPAATAADVEAFVHKHGIPYPVLMDDGSANARYRVSVLPTLIIVNRDGTIHRVLIGMTSKGTLADAIAAALARG